MPGATELVQEVYWERVLGLNISGFICLRVGVCGLEMLERKKTGTKEKTEIQDGVRGTTLSILNLPTFISHRLYIPQSKRGGGRQNTYLP